MADKEIQSWLWVVVMVVISIFGSITKNRKKREAEQAPPIDEDEEDYERDEPEVITRNDFWPEFRTMPTPFLDVELENVQPAVSVTPQQSMTPMTAITEEYATVDLDDPEEMRKAVIYSEIMKCKF